MKLFFKEIVINCRRNVYQIEAAEIRINGSFLLDHEGENLQMRLAAVNCAGCQTECGWKIVMTIMPFFFLKFFFFLIF